MQTDLQWQKAGGWEVGDRDWVGKGRKEELQRSPGNFWGDRCVYCLDYGHDLVGVHRGQNLPDCVLLNVYSLLYINDLSKAVSQSMKKKKKRIPRTRYSQYSPWICPKENWFPDHSVPWFMHISLLCPPISITLIKTFVSRWLWYAFLFSFVSLVRNLDKITYVWCCEPHLAGSSHLNTHFRGGGNRLGEVMWPVQSVPAHQW